MKTLYKLKSNKTTLIAMRNLIKKSSLFEIIVFFIIFLIFTVLGTLSHELGHYIVAKYLCFEPKFHYGFVTFERKIDYLKMDTILKQKYLITKIAGPLQTIITGLMGFVFLWLNLKNIKLKFSKTDWFAVFLSLFWLRECFNLLLIITSKIYKNDYPKNGDEVYISYALNLPLYFLNLILGIIGIVICYLVVFRIVPKNNRFNLIVGGFFGSIVGYAIWFGFLGKILLP